MNAIRSSLCLAAWLIIVPLEAAETKKTLTLEQTANRGDRVTFTTQIPTYSFDGEGMIVERGNGGSSKRLDPATLSDVPPAKDAPRDEARSRPDTDALAAALAKLPGMDEARAKSIVGGSGGRRAPFGGRSQRLLEVKGAWFIAGEGGLFVVRDGVATELLAPGGGEIELLTATADSSHLGFVKSNDLYTVATERGELRRVTDSGSADHFNGKLDWVYQEEVYGRGDFKGYFFSNDGKSLAFISLDESKVVAFPIADPIVANTFQAEVDLLKYPKAGDPNPIATFSLVDLATGNRRAVDLSRFAADEPILARVSFTPDSKHCLLVVQNRIQTWAELIAIDVATLTQSTWIREESPSWVERPDEPTWLKDGSFLWTSDRTGYRHFYHFAADGKLIGPVTHGDWSVTGIARVDEAAGQLWFTAKKDGAVDSNLYRVGLNGNDLVRVTPDPGTHDTQISPDGKWILDRWSSVSTPTRVRLLDAAGQVKKELAKSELTDEYAYAPTELFQVKARDGFLLDVTVTKPIPFDPRLKYPVWINTYSGPDSPTVSNRFSANAWTQFLAQNGVILLQLNVRTAAAIGRTVTSKCYKQLGVAELMDIEDAIGWVAQNPWANGKRVGITGYSYGGFITAYALTHSDKFALGIAGGGVYDWGMYDTIYTERYMDTPQRNPEGYAKTSVLKAAKDLKGHLLMHHGVNDDNVHLQNAMQFVYALQKADKSFEFMPYPESGHGIADRDQNWHFRQLEWTRIREHLLRPKGLPN